VSFGVVEVVALGSSAEFLSQKEIPDSGVD
jgi:hypothetical protein